MLIPLQDGKKKAKKDMSKTELADFEASERIAKSQPTPKVQINKHPGLRPAGVKKSAQPEKAKSKK